MDPILNYGVLMVLLYSLLSSGILRLKVPHHTRVERIMKFLKELRSLLITKSETCWSLNNMNCDLF